MKNSTTDQLKPNNIFVDVKETTPADVLQIVGFIGTTGKHVTIKNASPKLVADVMALAGIYSKNITFIY